MVRRWRAPVAAFMLAVLMLLALPAQAIQVSTGDPTPWYMIDSDGLDCPIGDTVRIRVETWGFGPLDSTGNTRLKWRDVWDAWKYKSYIGVEHDGVTRTWNTGLNFAHQIQVKFEGLSNSGLADATVYCG